MASIQPRERNGKKTYRVRYRDPNGRERNTVYDTLAEARRFKTKVEHELARGSYVDPDAGKVTLADYAAEYVSNMAGDPNTVATANSRLRSRILPHLGSYQLSALKPSHIQSWLGKLKQSYAPITIRNDMVVLSSILGAAVADDRLNKNPCDSPSIKRPQLDKPLVIPWSPEQVNALRAALPPRERLALDLTTDLGLRQGEVFGLALEDIDRINKKVHVRRQVKIVTGKKVYAFPKNRKQRTVPLPKHVEDKLGMYLLSFPATSVALPWETPTGKPEPHHLLITTARGDAVHRDKFNTRRWKPALQEAGMEYGPGVNTMHDGRHYFASSALHNGANIKQLAAWLGHSSVAFTLSVYTHLMPDSDDRGRAVLEAAHQAVVSVSAAGEASRVAPLWPRSG